MFRKIIGIIGILAVFGVIVMTAMSPRPSGFFSGMFDFLKRGIEVGPDAEAGTGNNSRADSLPLVDESENGPPIQDTVTTNGSTLEAADRQ